MKSFLLLITLLFSGAVFAQDTCREYDEIIVYLDNESVIETNQIKEYLKYDFSQLCMYNDYPYGIIGEHYQRLRIKFLKIEKSKEKPDEYLVYGKTKVKNKVRDFSGKIIIEKIQEITIPNVDIHFLRDSIYPQFPYYNMKVQCLLTAKYEFYEDKRQKNAGIFSGELKSKFFINRNDSVRYDNWGASDWYHNNTFVGTWKKYNSNVSKICNWGDYRVPSTNCDFDNGDGEFGPAKKYLKYGWRTVEKCYNCPPNDNFEQDYHCRACKKEREKWWK